MTEVIFERAETAAWIQRISDQDPALGIDDVFLRELRGVEPIGGFQQIGEAAESLGFIVVGDNARRTGSDPNSPRISRIPGGVGLTDMVVEPESGPLVVRQGLRECR